MMVRHGRWLIWLLALLSCGCWGRGVWEKIYKEKSSSYFNKMY